MLCPRCAAVGTGELEWERCCEESGGRVLVLECLERVPSGGEAFDVKSNGSCVASPPDGRGVAVILAAGVTAGVTAGVVAASMSTSMAEVVREGEADRQADGG